MKVLLSSQTLFFSLKIELFHNKRYSINNNKISHMSTCIMHNIVYKFLKEIYFLHTTLKPNKRW